MEPPTLAPQRARKNALDPGMIRSAMEAIIIIHTGNTIYINLLIKVSKANVYCDAVLAGVKASAKTDGITN